MHFTLSQRLFAFLALASGIGATINRPSESKGWQAEQDSLVEWDTAELTGPLNLHLCPGGAKDISQSIVQIAGLSSPCLLSPSSAALLISIYHHI
jgi:hypothetical protein